MYKLMLVTSVPEVLESFASIQSYEMMGFQCPVICANAQEAEELLKIRHMDGIAYELGDDENARFSQFLYDSHPSLPVFAAARTNDEAMETLRELSTLLVRLHADLSNDPISAYDMLSMCRHDFFRALLAGKIKGETRVRHSLRMLRSLMDPDSPCVIVQLSAPEDDDFISGRWHYGSVRLETAIRNFFGVEYGDLRILVCVMPDESIRLLFCTMRGNTPAGDSITGIVTSHTEESLALIDQYLGLKLSVKSITVLPHLMSLAM